MRNPAATGRAAKNNRIRREVCRWYPIGEAFVRPARRGFSFTPMACRIQRDAAFSLHQRLVLNSSLPTKRVKLVGVRFGGRAFHVAAAPDK
jgi:hypothetical protein